MEGRFNGFRDGMECVTSGEGWSIKYLVDNYPWRTFESGTVTDVSFCSTLHSSIIWQAAEVHIGGASGHACISTAEALPDLKFIVQGLEMGDKLVKQDRALTYCYGSIPWAMTSSASSQSKMPMCTSSAACYTNGLMNRYQGFEGIDYCFQARCTGKIQHNGLAPPGAIGSSEEINQRSVGAYRRALSVML